MSGCRIEIKEEEDISGEADDLIPRNRRPRDRKNEIRCDKEELHGVSEHQKKGIGKQEDAHGCFDGNKKNMRSKVKQTFLSPFRYFVKHLENVKKNKKAKKKRRSPSFPHDGDDFQGVAWRFPLLLPHRRNFKMVKTIVSYHLRFFCFLTLAEKHEFSKKQAIEHYTKDLKFVGVNWKDEVCFPTEKETRISL